MGDQAPSEDGSSSGDTSSLDHALLESLFYNEMMLIDDSSSMLSTNLFSSLSSTAAEGSTLPHDQELGSPSTDAGTMAEKALLSDFGVLETPSAQVVADSVPPSENARQALHFGGKPIPPMPPPSMPASEAPVSPEKRQKLVSQFATLASRLGIALPPHVLQSLSSAAAVQQAAPPTPAVQPPAVKQLESTAAAAIAAVTENRKRNALDASNSNNNGAAAATKSYAKRRKKPRLADCETKLAQLKAENELLKRHLHTVTNQSHKLDTERQEQERRMRSMLENGADPEEMDAAVRVFSEHYADYGRRRHQELAFHLEQLQRLANPTSFTKMGLWTMGQQSKDPKRNPIAGILLKELEISAQQGRKIIEQRQKIRDVCANLKECINLLSKLKALCEQKTKIFHDRMNKCREILTPQQVVKLMVWIDDHSSTLETVCPGWGSEQIHAKSKKPSSST